MKSAEEENVVMCELSLKNNNSIKTLCIVTLK